MQKQTVYVPCDEITNAIVYDENIKLLSHAKSQSIYILTDEQMKAVEGMKKYIDKAMEAIPDIDDMDYDPGDVINKIESALYKALTNYNNAFK